MEFQSEMKIRIANFKRVNGISLNILLIFPSTARDNMQNDCIILDLNCKLFTLNDDRVVDNAGSRKSHL